MQGKPICRVVCMTLTGLALSCRVPPSVAKPTATSSPAPPETVMPRDRLYSIDRAWAERRDRLNRASAVKFDPSAFRTEGLDLQWLLSDVSRLRDSGAAADGHVQPRNINTELSGYLQHYGYKFVADGTESGERSANTSTALVRFQSQMGLKETGALNADTLDRLSATRCGMPDADPIGAIATGPWRKRHLDYYIAYSTTQLPREASKLAIGAAFQTWAQAGVGLSFTELNAASGLALTL